MQLDTELDGVDDEDEDAEVLSLLALLVQKYSTLSYLSIPLIRKGKPTMTSRDYCITNRSTRVLAYQTCISCRRPTCSSSRRLGPTGAHSNACFTGTKVQILTQKADRRADAMFTGSASRAAGGRTEVLSLFALLQGAQFTTCY